MADIATGIDLGTSYSVIGVFKDWKVFIVPNSIGDSLTPSIVEILEKGESIGEETLLHKTSEKNTITEIKRLIGKKYSDIKDFSHIPYNIISNNDKIQIKIHHNGKDEYFSPEQIMSYIFKKLIKNASDFVDTSISKAVVTVPANFDYNQRSAIIESAKLAGIEVLRIINEPTAAALAYGLGTKENLTNSIALTMIKKDNIKKRKVLIFDLGGGTFDVTILILENNKFDAKVSKGDSFLGGNDFDNLLVDFCIKEFCQKMNVNENDIKKDSNALKRLKIQCEKAKKKLSKNKDSTVYVINFFNKINLNVKITRDTFNLQCDELFKRIEKILDEAIQESKFQIEEINDVIMVGGSSRIPKIKEILEGKFKDPKKIQDSVSQDEAIAIGATWQAYKLIEGNNTSFDLSISDITPFSLGVGIASKNKEERSKGHLMSILIDKNTKIPTRSKTKKVYKTAHDDQKLFDIKIYSGEEKYVKDNKLLKEIKIKNLPKGKAGTVSFTIEFEIDVNGILTINAEVESIGKKVTAKYSLYENENFEKKKLKHSIKPQDNKKLEEIKQITEFIREKNEGLNNIKNDNDKKEYLNDLCESCLKILKIYELLSEENDSENLYEKIFDYTKLLFRYYSKIIILDTENKKTSEIINKIKEIIAKFINDNIENFIETFNELKIQKPKIYIEIVLFCIELLYKEGDKILEAKEKYSRYYSKKYYQKAENIKNIIDKELENKMGMNLTMKFKEINKNYESKVAEINSFVKVIKDQIEGKQPPYFNKSGFTQIRKFVSQDIMNMNVDDVYLILDIFQDMADSFNQKSNSEEEAFCLTNVIMINLYIFKRTTKSDIKYYENLISRIEKICENLGIEEEQEEKSKWYKDYVKIKEEIEKIEFPESVPDNNEEIIKEIRDIFNKKVKEKQPFDFLIYILDRFPYINLDSPTKESLKKLSFEECLTKIFPKYHPDNYKDRNDYSIYNEIYILFVNLEQQFPKK